ncbi:glycosyltransferase family 4 protein [Legionella sp. km772]|uniref:glycosyltransferase family 4 protein n=1 Tax=Legionella sp. km772 TaxID=2498111 RepID=UPI000F8D9B53|nr:glycosyltransferase family 4 protein [Legionella sp. km772]RUR12751.1 glycosyltransferase family 1 protein [Legionella sp. km772]
MNSLDNVRIARVSTIPFFVYTQLRTQLEALADSGALVSIITSDDELSKKIKTIQGCTFKFLFIARKINPFSDLIALIKLWRIFRKEKYQIVHSTTPKAGLLCAIAAKLAGVPICIHTFTGQPWVTMTGIKRFLVKWSDKLIAKLDTYCYADSRSQCDFLIKNKIIAPNKLNVIGNGSLAGVDINRFSHDNFSDEDKIKLKAQYDIEPSAKILLFVGRVTREKGIFELIEAIQNLINKGQNIVLIVLGPFEQHNEQDVRSYAEKMCGKRVVFAGFHQEPERFMFASDLLCLPSYREGFGTVVIEAAAMGLPVIGTNIYGLKDAIIDGETGLLVEPKNSEQLTQVLDQLLSDDSLRRIMGNKARERARINFDSKQCNELLIKEYEHLLNQI